MSAEALRRKMRSVRSNLENVNLNLRNAQKILDDSITFDNEGFKSEEIVGLIKKSNKQITNINYNIIPNLYDEDDE